MSDGSNLVCRLEPLDPNLRGTFLPDGVEIIVGRSSEYQVSSVLCSRKQVALVADYKEEVVCVTVCGRTDSIVNDKVLGFGECYFASNGSIIELIPGAFKYQISFSECRKRTCNSPRPTTEEKMDSFTWEQLCNDEVLLGMHPEFDDYKRKLLSEITLYGFKQEDANIPIHLLPKIAAFDLDGTLIKTKSGNVFPKDSDDWTIWDESVKQGLAELHKNGYQVVIFTNQQSLSRPKGKMLLKDFKKKVETIVNVLGVPIGVFISIADGYCRKPAPGMWDILKNKSPVMKINMRDSFYVGDAAGRCANWKPGKKADFAASDRLFAINCRLKFLTPEQFFLKEDPVPYPELSFIPDRYDTLTDPEYTFPNETNEVIILVGAPGSGKSHFASTHLLPHQYYPVSRDVLGTWQKCVASMHKLLEANKRVVIDNVNFDKASRQRYIEACRALNVPVRCFVMKTPLERCLHNNKFRQITDPSHSVLKSQLIKSYFSTFEAPTLDEGYTEIVEVPFVPLFKDLEHERIYHYFLIA